MKTAIYSLYQRKELAKAKFFVKQCLSSLNKNRQLLIMVNDDGLDELESICRASPFIHIMGGNGNLGVAGGRNALISHGIEAGFDFFISCDNDIILENDYFANIEADYQNLKRRDANIGLVQPVLLDGRRIKDLLGITGIENWADLGAAPLQTTFLGDIWRNLVISHGRDKATAAIYHAGISNPWIAHFQGLAPSTAADAPWDVAHETRFLTNLPMLRHAPGLLASVIDAAEPVKVFTVAGGITAFHKDVIDVIGLYNEKFNPFGYEDSELGFRATRLGLNNYLLSGVLSIHDPFMGASNRPLSSHATIARLRAIEISDLAGDDRYRGFALAQSIFFCWIGHNGEFKTAIDRGELAKESADQTSVNFFANYVLNFLYGIFGCADFKKAGQTDHLFDRLIPAGFSSHAMKDASLNLGRDGRFCASDVELGQALASDGHRILHLSAMNCRIEENAPSAPPLTSRYADVYLTLTEIGVHQFELKLNLQADADTYSAKVFVDVTGSMSSGFRHPPQVRVLESKRNTYDLGSFSRESIYPEPNLVRSAKWWPELKRVAAIIKADGGAFSWLFEPLVKGLKGEPSLPRPTTAPSPKAASGKKRILVFTDSRGQHKPVGQDHVMFAERLKADPGLEVDLFLCPMKWTTTLDFLATFDREKLKSYAAIVLWTGIVDWSPRPVSSAKSDLYDNPNASNLENATLNTRDYSKKVVNSKKKIFDEIFGESAVQQYFAAPSETLYAGEKTSNMYGLDMARKFLLPRLAEIPNLVFINSNRFVPGWEGDFKKGRPANIDITHQYSDLFTESLAKSARVIDLRKWSLDQVKQYTCDNLHITAAGNDYIYGELMAALSEMGITSAPAAAPTGNLITRGMSTSFTGITNPERILGVKQQAILESSKATGKYLATLIIGVRLKPGDEVRLRNFELMLKWLEHHYSGLFDVLIVEQDGIQRLDMASLSLGPHARHEFIYNPGDYNRGWGYNVAVKHFCNDAQVVVLMDTDVLTGANFVREVMDCYTKYDAISPYQNIYYSTLEEAESVGRTMRIDQLTDPKRIRNPVTIAGGLLIIRRDIYLSLKGFEQYVGYGCEDRALDVTLFNHIQESRLRIAPASYVHLHHPRDQDGRDRFEEIYEHLVTHYRCKYEKGLGPFDFIHKFCHHASALDTLTLMRQRAESFGDPDLYRDGERLPVNGQKPRTARASCTDVIYPPDFSSIFDYKQREIYKSAPEPDSAELATFYNAYRGKRCFIIGNGPSLNKHDLTLLENEYTFGVNSFYYKTRETGFTPYFYVVEDSSVMKENIEEIRSYSAPFKLFPTNYKTLHPKQPNTFFFRMNRGFYEKSSPNFVVPRFSTDASDVLYCGQSVTYINLQLAYFMGFEEVYLIGMDFSYVIPESHSRKGDVLLSDTDDPNHFHKDYFGKGKTWKDPKLDRVALNYKMAKLVYESTGRRVLNATIGGSLEVFQRVDYASLFGAGETPEAAKVERVTFNAANRFFQDKDYPKALSAYIDLARRNSDFQLYKRSAVESYMRAAESGQSCSSGDVAYVRGLMFGM